MGQKPSFTKSRREQQRVRVRHLKPSTGRGDPITSYTPSDASATDATISSSTIIVPPFAKKSIVLTHCDRRDSFNKFKALSPRKQIAIKQVERFIRSLASLIDLYYNCCHTADDVFDNDGDSNPDVNPTFYLIIPLLHPNTAKVSPAWYKILTEQHSELIENLNHLKFLAQESMIKLDTPQQWKAQKDYSWLLCNGERQLSPLDYLCESLYALDRDYVIFECDQGGDCHDELFSLTREHQQSYFILSIYRKKMTTSTSSDE